MFKVATKVLRNRLIIAKRFYALLSKIQTFFKRVERL